MWDAYWEHAQILTYCSGTTAAAVTVGWASLRGTCALEITAQSPNGGRNIWAPKPTGSHWILVPSSTSWSYFNQPTKQTNHKCVSSWYTGVLLLSMRQYKHWKTNQKKSKYQDRPDFIPNILSWLLEKTVTLNISQRAVIRTMFVLSVCCILQHLYSKCSTCIMI